MSRIAQDLQEVARYNLGRKQASKIVGLFLFCLVVPFLLFCALPLFFYPQSFPWSLLVSCPLSTWLYKSQYKKMLEKEIRHLNKKDPSRTDRG